MSLNLLIFFVFSFISLTILSAIVDGHTGLETTNLTANLSETGTTMSVTTTDLFPSRDGIVQIENEIICYGGVTSTTFTDLSRGEDCRKHSVADAHVSGVQVMGQATGIINNLIGFDIATAFSDGGIVGFVKGLWTTATMTPQWVVALFHMVLWDYSFLTGPFVYIKYLILYPLSAGMVLSILRLALGR